MTCPTCQSYPCRCDRLKVVWPNPVSPICITDPICVTDPSQGVPVDDEHPGAEGAD